MNLFRPVGVHELRLIAASAWRAFPPRLPGQPIFYPVLDYDYAVQIARDWNRNDQASGFAGFVTAFAIEAAFASQFDVQVVGGRQHRELWVPAAQLPEFNGHIIGRIEVLASFYGERCKDAIDAATNLPDGICDPGDGAN